MMISLPDYTDAQFISFWMEISRHAKRRGFILVIDEFTGFEVRKQAPEGSHFDAYTLIGKCTTLGELELIVREDEIPGLREPLDEQDLGANDAGGA